MKAPIEVGYKLAETEQKAAQEFMDKHAPCRKRPIHGDAWPDGVSYRLYGLSVGNGIVIQCDFCREAEDITDVSFW